MSGYFEFLKASLKKPLQLSTPFASGPRVGKRFARHIHLRDDEILVELGVGSGAVTDHILSQLKDRSRYVGFELNNDLYKFLSKEKYPDLEIIHDSADHMGRYLKGRKVGAVISTLPWSLIQRDTRMSILNQVYNTLEPGGLFGIFFATHALLTPAVRDFWQQLCTKFPDYSYVDEIWNLPPCRLYFARKR
jgi:phosphatidylethanolamine/phosphatidyl-N-methylethanolamine N-methyltransferase